MRGSGVFDIEDREFDELRELIRAKVGIHLNDGKRALVVGRLAKRLRHHGYTRFAEYLRHLAERDANGAEALVMINCITTNKTEFFRERHHFDWLRDELVPEYRRRAQRHGHHKLRIWSAGCSTGQEPYSIAMV